MWTSSPGAMSRLAKPMIWPYFVTASPLRMGRSATLWPRPTRPAAVIVSAPTASRWPAGMVRAATATLSSGRRWTAKRDRGSADMGSVSGGRELTTEAQRAQRNSRKERSN